jgi:hypothetical protein
MTRKPVSKTLVRASSYSSAVAEPAAQKHFTKRQFCCSWLPLFVHHGRYERRSLTHTHDIKRAGDDDGGSTAATHQWY